MKSSIQLLVASRPVSSSMGAATEGMVLTSRCITFLTELAMSKGEEKLSPIPAIAEKGDRARNLTMCWMNLLSNSEPLTKGAPRGSQPGRKALLLSGKERSVSPTFRVDATTQARSWKSPNTLALYFLTSSRMGFGSDGNFGQPSEGKKVFRGARSLGTELGNRRGYSSHARTLVSLTVRWVLRLPFFTFFASTVRNWWRRPLLNSRFSMKLAGSISKRNVTMFARFLVPPDVPTRPSLWRNSSENRVWYATCVSRSAVLDWKKGKENIGTSVSAISALLRGSAFS
mmetsp:Transcript_65898/g.192781  ORF Transcript_65898/g.192781 Transcript_65898/m.192781 type:complete len:286 (-) Transcript_65898:733-1590(-)